jgi:hypothetical protein
LDPETKKPLIETYHMCPVSLKDLPKLQENLNAFFQQAQSNQGTGGINSQLGVGGEWTPEKISAGGKIISLSLSKMHPEITEDIAVEKFGLGGLAKAVKIAMDINNFLSEMGEIQTASTKVRMMTPQS